MPPDSSFHYDDPNEFLHDLQRGKLPASAVTLEQFVLAHAWCMIDHNSPHITKRMMINGTSYAFDMRLNAVVFGHPPSDAIDTGTQA